MGFEVEDLDRPSDMLIILIQRAQVTLRRSDPLTSRHFRRANDMAQKVPVIGLALALVTMLLLGLASGQSGCTTAIIRLAPCLNYITGNTSTPSSTCCSQLASVVQSQPACLCSVLNGGASSLGLTINQTRALALPGACKVQTLPVSESNSKHSINIHRHTCGRWTGKISDSITDDSGNTVNARQSRAGDPSHTSSSKSRFYCYYYVGFSGVKSRAVEVIYMLTSSVYSSNV
ncbi:hypothetical protein C4D60_Mb07t21160 [Musa balbisiana]|uniref:Bifunctional inhibitor/plant lipid transfer protein/seed storage helical domain-containing protein n=1 Tax=Musa balbisiana TaxID=52838 RepID=A0A4S8JIV0_MUSBA|nr:hypothetical protein C4D60_Mb07t21160 [Musa balbisiana]